MSKKYFGIDISEHNGKVNWKKVAKNVDFVILRIGWVGNEQNKMDVLFNANYEAAKKAGIKLGAYIYMYSKTEFAAQQGANWILKQIKDKKFDLPIYCDMEDVSISKLSKTNLSRIASVFCDTIKEKGHQVGIYANKYWFDSKLNKNLRTKYHTWIAHYTSGTDKYKGEYEMWQYSSTGKIKGVKGKVDTNWLYENIFTNKKQTFVITAKSGLRLREKPVNGKILVVMSYGSKVSWYGKSETKDGVIWRYVKFKVGNKTYKGYCSNEYLKKGG